MVDGSDTLIAKSHTMPVPYRYTGDEKDLEAFSHGLSLQAKRLAVVGRMG